MISQLEQSHGASPSRPGKLLLKCLMLLAMTASYAEEADAIGLPANHKNSSFGSGLTGSERRSSSPPLTMVGGSNTDDEDAGPTSITEIVGKMTETSAKVSEKTTALATAFYGLSLVGYGHAFPAQMRVLSIANVGGFNRIRRSIRSTLKKGSKDALITTLLNFPSLLFVKGAIKRSQERKQIAIQYQKEHDAALADGKMSEDEYKELKKLRKIQVKAEYRAIRQMRRGRNFFSKLAASANPTAIKTVVGDVVLMCTAIAASRQPSVLGNFIYRYYMVMNMGELFLEINRKIGYPFGNAVSESLYVFNSAGEELVLENPGKKKFLGPVSEFFLSKIPFVTTYEEGSKEVAGEEVAFIRNVGSLITYGFATFLVLSKPLIARRLNAALLASSMAVHGLAGVLNDSLEGPEDQDKVMDPEDPAQPGKLRGGYGGQLTLALTAVSMLTGHLLDANKIQVPGFWTPMSTVGKYMDKAFEYGDKVL